jgi:glutamate racemase
MNRPVVFIDSGLGGIPYCRDFSKRNPDEEIYYIADRENFPYGPRGKDELILILTELTEKLLKTANPKIIVLACNTASVCALSSLRQSFAHIPFVGTVPAIKPAANACKSGKIGVLGTARTIEDIHSLNIADVNENRREIYGISAPELVLFIEQRFEEADEKEKKETVKKYVGIFRAAGIDTLVLGCTHFLYLLEEFRREAYPAIKIFDSLDGITKRIEFLLDENNSALRAGKQSKRENRILLTGKRPADSAWQNRAQAMGFKLNLLNEI